MISSPWRKAAIILVLVWVGAGGVIFWASRTKPTPERLATFLSENPLENSSGRNRAKIIDGAAEQLNALSYEQRREVRVGKKLDAFFRSLTPEEQTAFLDRTLPSGFKQMMDSLNKMDPAKRRKFVERTLNDLRREEGNAPKPDDPNIERIVQQGMKSFYSEANAEVKMDLTPLIEQMQKNIQSGR
ncbi:MAG TPA: hypothetical protein VF593_03225 [Chthoniobacteraceae bacterium]